MTIENPHGPTRASGVPGIALRQRRHPIWSALFRAGISALSLSGMPWAKLRADDLPDPLRSDVGLPQRYEPVRYEEFLNRR